MRPTHRLRILNKANDARGTAGAGWQNDDGSITVVLDPCVVLTSDPNIVITLFPEGKK